MKSKGFPEALAWRQTNAEVNQLRSPAWLNMAATEEKQQGHRAGVYKQKNKVHKHGKHRTKGEVERDNKGKLPSGVFKVGTFCYLAFLQLHVLGFPGYLKVLTLNCNVLWNMSSNASVTFSSSANGTGI